MFAPGITEAGYVQQVPTSLMKRRPNDPIEPPASATDALCDALAALSSVGEVRAFLEDLCTPAELEAMADRWRVVPLLIEGVPYREIHDRTAVSVTTIGRVARCLTMGHGGYRMAAARQAEPGRHRG
jgi:TrpR-related protein YerC/YecD